MPGIYRQTAENTGMYTPIKRQLVRSHQIVPSKNCASQKIIDYTPNHQKTTCKNSTSMPVLRNTGTRTGSSEKLQDFYERPRTPPEKRYSATFGMRAVPDRRITGVRQQRPRSSYIYENVHADDFCVGNYNECNRVKNVRGLPPNVKVTNFPTPHFSRMYIQDSLD